MTSNLVDQAFFKSEYAKDERNRAKQSEKEYLEWVRSFYEGKRFPPVAGWNDREKEILARVAPADQARVREALAGTGRVLAAEWAKDNGVRRVSTSDLQAWGSRFKAAADAGALVAALDAVRAEVAARRQ